VDTTAAWRGPRGPRDGCRGGEGRRAARRVRPDGGPFWRRGQGGGRWRTRFVLGWRLTGLGGVVQAIRGGGGPYGAAGPPIGRGGAISGVGTPDSTRMGPKSQKGPKRGVASNIKGTQKFSSIKALPGRAPRPAPGAPRHPRSTRRCQDAGLAQLHAA
jgi:hypothetical protein